MREMKERYGDKHGEEVFYATAKKEGQEPAEDSLLGEPPSEVHPKGQSFLQTLDLKPVGSVKDAAWRGRMHKALDCMLDKHYAGDAGTSEGREESSRPEPRR